MDTTKPIHLIIDTSVLRASPYYKSEEYKSLEILTNKGLLKIYLPYIIENEYIEQLKEEYLEKFNSIKKSLETLKNLYLTNTEGITNIEQSIIAAENNTIENIIKDFEINFCTKLKIKKLDIKSHYAKEVFDKYFKGSSPFKNKKNRADIPDAFIFECIRDIKNKESNTIVLVNDNRLHNACNEIGATPFTSLKEFIEYKEIQNILNENINFLNFINYLKSNDNIENFLEDYHIKELEYMTITSYDIPSDDNSAQIIGIDVPKNIECDFEKLIHYGNKKIGIPVTFDIEVIANLYIFKADYYGGDYGFSVEDCNDHYFSADNNYLLKIESVVIVDISQIDFSVSDINFDEYFDKNNVFSLNTISNIEVIEESDEYIKCKCKQCGKVKYIPSKNLDWERIESEEREMGIENHYSTNYEFICECGNNISLEFDTWEYPIGTVNYCESNLKGCEINKNITYKLNRKH
ncbi:hypothetical protein DU472_04540 [Campylobacter novaezeelandiae]|uniref:PIN domain-containing protein n=1 Tax=Campylobacter novaezeelandiae TaxID=2267891 RepID=UPI0010380784|nr:PIN domain-containing protein [Campylobacter novaezeelandiae]TBR80930.1 hypothetical protein DU472_04540 [Campylobacter novaezeelandiae]